MKSASVALQTKMLNEISHFAVNVKIVCKVSEMLAPRGASRAKRRLFVCGRKTKTLKNAGVRAEAPVTGAAVADVVSYAGGQPGTIEKAGGNL